MPEKITQVHTIETSAPLDLPSSYREYRTSFHRDEYNRTAEIYSQIDKEEDKARFELLKTCRTRAYFAKEKISGLIKILSNACHLRWCPLCSSGKSNYIIPAISKYIKTGKNPKLLTLTLKHSDAPLSFQLDSIYKAFRSFRQNRQFRKECYGGIWFFQIKYIPESDSWHPHIHCLVTGNFLPKEWLSELWLKHSQSSFIVDIRRVYKPEKACEYVARYCVRPCQLSSMPYSRSVEVVRALHGRRLSGTWGNGCDVALRPPKSSTREQYESLGSYTTILELAKVDSIALSIVRSWKDKTPFTDEINFRGIDNFINNIPTVEFEVLIPDSQHTFEFS